MRTVAIIQARMASTRLPGKVIAEAAGKPLLTHMIERLKRCETLDGIVVAIPTRDYYYELRNVVHDAGAWTFCGPEEDVLTRVLLAARGYQADLIVELTGDCPLIDPEVVDTVVARSRAYDFIANTREVRDALYPELAALPRGMDVRVFPTEVLARVSKMTLDPTDREHVSLYIWEHPETFSCRYVAPPAELVDDVRLTVDTPKDLALTRAIFEAFAPRNDFDLQDVLRLLADRPELREINRHVEQKTVR